MDTIKMGISRCLLGEKVRYDGQHKLDRFLRDRVGPHVSWVPVCPEVECGLSIPREAMRLVGDPVNPRLVTQKTGVEITPRMMRWAEGRLAELAKEELCGFVFMRNSPSSGMQSVKVYNDKGYPSKKGVGIFARAFMERFPLIPVEDNGRLNDLPLRESFMERVFVFHRWRQYEDRDGSIGGLVRFHTGHKLIIMAHSPKHLRHLGKIVAAAKGRDLEELRREYVTSLMEGLKLRATVKKNTNVLQHIAGYFKHLLTKDEKAEVQELVGQYHDRLVPLIVPITLLSHFVRKYEVTYLAEQLYLNPHPKELMLRNHW